MLGDLVQRQAQLTPEALAVKDSNASLTYRDLDYEAQSIARKLEANGIRRGDRVGLWLEKTVHTVAAMQGILRLGAAYVPLDPLSPAARIGDIVSDCRMKAVITTQYRREKLAPDPAQTLNWFVLENGTLMEDRAVLAVHPEAILSEHDPMLDSELAYILYTSGSTGKPKGVCISHRNALAFIEWVVAVLQPDSHDRFANHAPFHFDISVLDLYVAFSVGAMVFLLSDAIAYMPARLVTSIVQEQLTVWYSVPSALVLMMEEGGMTDLLALPLRAILFAGEPFPLKHFQKLYRCWPQVRYLNLYGPTETNVCTYYEVPSLPLDEEQTLPIGKACSGDRVWVQKEDGSISEPGEIGELIVAGPTVMLGYWGKAIQGTKPYATGDLVRQRTDGNYIYLGRRDHMVKVRGYRIELAEIEIVLAQHPEIREVAVVVVGQEMQARLTAFLVPAHPDRQPSLLEMKHYCAQRLPRYMIIDTICILSELPRTRNGKVDRLVLLQDGSALRKGQTHAKS